MAEPNATGAAAAAAGLTVFGVATGLDPAILIAGFAGGVWGQSYHPPTTFWRRLLLVMLASIIAGYLAPAAAVGAMAMTPAATAGAMSLATLQLPVAVLIGLTSHRVLGPAVMRLAAKKIEDLTK